MVGGESLLPAAIIPVIDVLGGQVVRGIAGNRSEYRPLVSCLAKDASPPAVANGLAQIGASTIYVADLDAIQRPSPAQFPTHLSTAYAAIAAANLHVWLDAGIGSEPEWQALLPLLRASRLSCDLIVGLETLRSIAALKALLLEIGPERLIFSLDMKSGQPLTSIEALHAKSPLQIAQAAIEAGVSRMILLDLADVGMSGGTRTLSLCAELHALHPSVSLIAGGGVRTAQDLTTFAQQGCAGALVASALHDGRLTPPLLFWPQKTASSA